MLIFSKIDGYLCGFYYPQQNDALTALVSLMSFSELNFGWQDRLYSIPLYAAWCI